MELHHPLPSLGGAPLDPGNAGPERLEERLRTVGAALADALGALLEAVPGSPHRPNPLARTLGVNRAVTSRLLAAVDRGDPMEVLHLVPGPEPLRKVLAGSGLAADDRRALAVEAAVAAFAALIDEEAGTRPALEALLAPHLPGAAEKLELSSRYAIHKGMTQLKGVQAELWIGAAVIVPSTEDPERLDLTWLTGAHAMHRLRPGVDVRFSYRAQRGSAPPGAAEPMPEPSLLSLEAFCRYPVARLETHRTDGTIHYTLRDDLLGPRGKADLFVVDHHPAAMRRYGDDEDHAAGRARTGLFVEPAIPSARLVFDVLLHDDVFPGAEPELVVYDTNYNGVANVNDRSRDLDRVATTDHPELLGHGLERFGTAELSTYGPMLAHLAAHFGWDGDRLRGYRVEQAYPVYGWQVTVALQQPRRP